MYILVQVVTQLRQYPTRNSRELGRVSVVTTSARRDLRLACNVLPARHYTYMTGCTD